MRAERAFKKKKKTFFIIFKGLSMKQTTQIFLEVESPSLILITFLFYFNKDNSFSKWLESINNLAELERTFTALSVEILYIFYHMNFWFVQNLYTKYMQIQCFLWFFKIFSVVFGTNILVRAMFAPSLSKTQKLTFFAPKISLF